MEKCNKPFNIIWGSSPWMLFISNACTLTSFELHAPNICCDSNNRLSGKPTDAFNRSNNTEEKNNFHSFILGIPMMQGSQVKKHHFQHPPLPQELRIHLTTMIKFVWRSIIKPNNTTWVIPILLKISKCHSKHIRFEYKFWALQQPSSLYSWGAAFETRNTYFLH